MLHRLNLPAGTDVSRILNELGQLKRQVRELSTSSTRPGPSCAADRRRRRRSREAAAGGSGRRSGRRLPDGRHRRLPASSSSGSAGTPSATCCASATGSSTSPASAGRELTQTPKETVWSAEKVELWRYPSDRRTIRTPLLFVHSLVSRSYVFDLVPGNSFVETMVDRGFDVYLVDWGVPDELEAGNTLETYTDGYLPTIVARGRASISGSPDVNVFGYCFGGVLSLLVGGRQPRRCRCAAWP